MRQFKGIWILLTFTTLVLSSCVAAKGGTQQRDEINDGSILENETTNTPGAAFHIDPGDTLDLSV